MRFKSLVLQLILPILITITLFIPSSIAIMMPIPTAQLAREADVVVLGKVSDTVGKWAKDNSAIVTQVTVGVQEVIRGTLKDDLIVAVKKITKDEDPKNIITVEYPGGTVGDISFGMSDTPTFHKNEEVLLFLKEEKSLVDGEVYFLVGSSQGKYTITEDGIASKEGYAVYSDNEEDYELIDNLIPLKELLNKIDVRDHAFIHLDKSKQGDQK